MQVDGSLTRPTKAFLVVWGFATAFLVGCADNGSTPRPPSSASPAPPPVEIIQPQMQSLCRFVEQPGAIQAFEESRLFARVTGYVSNVGADIGQHVRGPKLDSSGNVIEQGQILAEIAVPDLQEEANQKQALTRQADAEIEQTRKAQAAAEANIGTLEAGVVEAKALLARWESEAKRIAKIVASGSVDVQTGDEMQNQLKAAGARVQSAEAAVVKAKADRDKAAADVQTAQARLAVAHTEARRLQELLGFAKIRAPFDGVVTVRKVNTGDLVLPGNGTSLFTIARLDPVRIVIAVPEADAGLVKEKAETELTIRAAQSTPIKAVITRISWALDPGARTLRAEIDLPNKDGKLRPGMYVYAQIKNECPKAWTLPVSAVVKQGDAMVCFLVEEGKALRTPVQLGRSDGKFVEVLKRQKAGTPPTWDEFSGNEAVAIPALGLTNGQPMLNKSKSK